MTKRVLIKTIQYASIFYGVAVLNKDSLHIKELPAVVADTCNSGIDVICLRVICLIFFYPQEQINLQYAKTKCLWVYYMMLHYYSLHLLF